MKNSLVRLINTEKDHLKILYQFQLDDEGNYLAAFTSKESSNRDIYLKKYAGFLMEPSINMQTIIYNGDIVGSISKFVMDERAEITYWIDRNFWGLGICTSAINDFLKTEQTRPIYGRVAYDNIGSQKVLEKCGFIKIGIDKGFANARQMEIEEYIYKLS